MYDEDVDAFCEGADRRRDRYTKLLEQTVDPTVKFLTEKEEEREKEREYEEWLECWNKSKS